MTEPYDAVEIIAATRDCIALTADQIRWWIDAYMRGVVTDPQMSAWTMAVYQRSLTDDETLALTIAMIDSGERLDLSSIDKPIADKHSTGGVGDKITLPLMPLVASFGVAVPQLSGRGLGHTGGTLDKLEAIPGWQANRTNAEMLWQLRTIGGIVCAAGSGLAPADKRMYALRDETATVAAVPLIASSIMSKKIAEGTDSLILDVKFGRGAFMHSQDEARVLASEMVRLGNAQDVQTRALLTRMDAPIGYAIGNGNEVAEALEVLSGGGPRDVVELTIALAEQMLEMAGVKDADCGEALRNGQAMDVWRAAVTAQGGNPDAPLPDPTAVQSVTATKAGYVSRLDAMAFGTAAWRLGAGRSVATDAVSMSAGITLAVAEGDFVNIGDKLYDVLIDDEARVARALEVLEDAVEIGDQPVSRRPRVAELIAP